MFVKHFLRVTMATIASMQLMTATAQELATASGVSSAPQLNTISYPQTKYPSLVATNATASPSSVTLRQTDDLLRLINNAPGGVIIDFFADWCGPCRIQSAILREMQPVLKNHKALVIKIDVDEHPALAQQLQIAGLPTLMVVRDGKVVERKTGIADHRAIASFLAR